MHYRVRCTNERELRRVLDRLHEVRLEMSDPPGAPKRRAVSRSVKSPADGQAELRRSPLRQMPLGERLLTVRANLKYIQCKYMATATQISRWGNSLGLRLPKSVAREAQVDEGVTVDVSVKNGAIVIRLSRPAYSLEQLVAKITPPNRHT